MTCYQRHMGWLFDALGLPYEREQRAAVDRALRDVFGLGDDAHCPEVWAAVKSLTDEETATLAGQVRERLG